MIGKSKNPWVKLARTVQFDHGTELPGTVGIKVGPAKMLQDGKPVDIPGHSEVHLVHAKSGVAKVPRVVEGARVIAEIPHRGGDTREIVAVKDADLELVTDRNDVPADRLATYAADWQPKAAAVKS